MLLTLINESTLSCVLWHNCIGTVGSSPCRQSNGSDGKQVPAVAPAGIMLYLLNQECRHRVGRTW